MSGARRRQNKKVVPPVPESPSESTSSQNAFTPPANTSDPSRLLIAVGIAIACLAVYAQVVRHDFVNFDDPRYLIMNPMVAGGLTLEGVKWAFTTFYIANWHPLTWLSYMLDVQLFGPGPVPHLVINVLLHIMNSLLLFALLDRITGYVGRSAMVAALFALHPMHVESVAWASERKDVLSSFFALLCLLAYVRYARQQPVSRNKFIPVVVLLALALMAKPMFVTWPFVMLLLDFWPLGRIQWNRGEALSQVAARALALVREKAWLFALVAVSSLMTYVAQAGGGAVASLADPSYTLYVRVANALTSYVRYAASLVWPTRLAVFYPMPSFAAVEVVAAAALLGAISIWAIRTMRSRGYFIVGWAWFLGTLVPVIGLVKVGGQSMADRYSYIPSIGFFVILVWGLAEFRLLRLVRWVGAALWLLALLSAARAQTSSWKDSFTLFQHALDVGQESVVAHFNLADALESAGRLDEAVTQYNEVLRLNPESADALYRLGILHGNQQKFPEAIANLERALSISPNAPEAHSQLAIVLSQTGKEDEALSHLERAAELAPDDAQVRTRIVEALLRKNRLQDARQHLERLVSLEPDNAAAHHSFGVTLLVAGQTEKAIAELETALRLNPDLKNAREILNVALKQRNSGK